MKHKFKIKWPIIFPRIPRRIPEWPQIELISWGLILIALILNAIFDFLPRDLEEMKLRQNVLKDPFSMLTHQKLADYYLNYNFTEAEKEFYLAEAYYQSELTDTRNINLLGVQSSPLTTWNNLINYKEKILKEISDWEELGKKHSQYEYIQLKVSTLYYRLGEYEKARLILQRLLKQNPTLNTAQSLYSKLN